MTLDKFKKIGVDGLLKNNPTFRLVLGTCPTLALTTAAMNGIGMGLAVTFILICSNVMISLLRKVIPNEVRIPAFVLIIATFVTIVRMLLDKFIPSLYESMGVYLPLIVVNCIILGRAESFASKNPVLDSAVDGLASGLGFTWAMTSMAIIREVLGAGQLFGITLWDFKIEFFSSSAGAFFVFAICIALFNKAYSAIENKLRQRKFKKQYETPLQETDLKEIKLEKDEEEKEEKEVKVVQPEANVKEGQ